MAWDNVVDYFDDLLVHTRIWEEHVRALKELFKRLKAANVVARPTKCVDFLGHCLGQGMIGLQDVNVQRMRDAPRPTTKKEMRSFLGLAGYYLPGQHRWQGVCQSGFSQTPGPHRAHPPRIPVRLQKQEIHSGHDLLHATAPGEVPLAGDASLHRLHRPHQGI